MPRSVRGRNPELLAAQRGAFGKPRAVVECRTDVLVVVVDGGRVYHRGHPVDIRLDGPEFLITWVDERTGQPREQRMGDWPVGCKRCPDGTHMIDSRKLRDVVNLDKETRVTVARVGVEFCPG